MRRTLILLAALAAVLAMAAHHQALNAGLVFDDAAIVGDGSRLTLASAADLGPLLSSAWWQGEGRDLLWRPLTLLTFAMQSSLGATPGQYHGVNIALHGMVTALLFLLTATLLAGYRGQAPAQPASIRLAAAFAGAVLFGVHPLGSEAVTLLVGRADLLVALAGLAVLLTLAPWPRERRGWRPALAAVLTLAACLAKENGFILPLLAALLLLVPPAPAGAGVPRMPWRRTLPALAAVALGAAVALLMRILVLGQLMRPGGAAFADNPIAHAGFWGGRLAALHLLGYGGLLFAWPHPLSVDYSYAAVPIPALSARHLLLTAAGALAVAAGVFLLRRWPLALWGLAFFVLAQALTANLLLPIGTVFGERLLYLPMAGLAMAMAALLHAAATTGVARGMAPALRSIPAAALVLFLAGLAMLTGMREQVYRDDLILWQQTAAVVPRSARAQYNLGRSLAARDRHEQAAAAYRQTLAILSAVPDHLQSTGHLQALTNLAASQLRLQHPGEALTLLDQAAASYPQAAEVAFNRALALQGVGRPDDAAVAFQRGAALDPATARSLAARGEPWRGWFREERTPSPPQPADGD